MDAVMWLTFVPIITFVIFVAALIAMAHAAVGKLDSTDEDDNLW